MTRVVMAGVLLAVGMGVWGGGSTASGSSEVTLQYTCTLSPFPGQPMVAQLTWNAPTSMVVGKSTPTTITVNATATVGPTVTFALGVDGAATVEGSVDAPGMVVAPEGTIPSALQLNVPRTDVPASGPMTFQASGTAPSLVFHQPGHATVNVSSNLTLHLTPRDSNGNLTSVGNVDLPCTLDPGQSTVVFAFDILPMPTAQPASPTAPTATTGPAPAPAPTPTATEPPATVTLPSPTSSTSSPSPTTTSTAAQPVVPAATPPRTTELRASDRAAGLGRAVVGWWLTAAGILAAVAVVIAAVWWHTRRRRRVLAR